MRLDEASQSGQQPETPELAPPTAALLTRQAGFSSTVRLALLRASHTRWLLLVVALGILLADILICTVPLYNTLVSNVQLQNAIANSAGVKSNMQVSVQTTTVNRTLQDQADAIIRKTERQYLGSVSRPTPSTYIAADVTALTQLGSQRFEAPVGEVRTRMETADFASAAPYLRFTAGTAPQDTAPGEPIQIAVTQDMAHFLNVAVGQQIVFANLNAADQRVTGVIVGIFEQKNRDDPFWNGRKFDLEGGPDGPTVYPVVTTTNNFYAAFSGFTGLYMTQTWVYYTRLDQVTVSTMGAVAQDIQAFRVHATVNVQAVSGVIGTTTLGNFDQTIMDLQRQLSLIALPLYVIAAQIVGLALLFVAAMAGILIERQQQGIAMLKSRGMSSPQLLGVFGVQSALLAAVAIILGPLLATGLALLLIHL
ncbi:MAG TPA: FtsX-like permease family protein, partial [Ktedonobacterales bacterium]|nr:FtsX-like permease family protein [Ktedonobacterales bacterium]